MWPVQMVRQAHHPEPSRKANHNDQNSKYQTMFWSLKNWDLRSVWNLIHWSLRFIWPATSSVESNLVLEIWDLNEFIFEKEDL
jgi:hypothetical protein